MRCLACDSEFYVQPSAAGKRKYCSIACSSAHRKAQIKCLFCKKSILKPKFRKAKYCSKKCASVHREQLKPKVNSVEISCQYCNNQFHMNKSLYDRRPRKYCSKICGIRDNKSGQISKIEKYFVTQLRLKYPELNIIENDRTVFDGLEIDIWIPSLRLAIECNGPCHYKPIFGDKGLVKTQQNDKKKELLSIKADIRLFIIDVSNQYCYTKIGQREILQQLSEIIDCIESAPN